MKHEKRIQQQKSVPVDALIQVIQPKNLKAVFL